MEKKMGNFTHAFREAKLVIQLMEKSLKIKLCWAGARQRKQCIFSMWMFFCPKDIFIYSSCIFFYFNL